MTGITKALRSYLTYLGVIHLGVGTLTFGMLYIAVRIAGRETSVSTLSVLAVALNPPIVGSLILFFYVWRWERIFLRIARAPQDTDRDRLARKGYHHNTTLLERLDQLGGYRLFATSIYVVHYIGLLSSKHRLSSGKINATGSAAEAEAHSRVLTVFLHQHTVSKFVTSLARDERATRRRDVTVSQEVRGRVKSRKKSAARERVGPSEQPRRSEVRLKEALDVLDGVFESKTLRDMVVATYSDGDGFLSTLSLLHRLGLSAVVTNDLRRRIVSAIEASIESPATLGWLSYRCFEYALVAHLNGKDVDSVSAFLRTHVSAFCSVASSGTPEQITAQKWLTRKALLEGIASEASGLNRR